MDQLRRVIEENAPDVVCLTEVRAHHLKHFQDLMPHLFGACKYHGTFWSRLPWFRKNQIALLSKEYVHTELESFSKGMKRVFLRFTSAFGEGNFVHLALRKKQRSSQIEHLRKKTHDRAFFFGDFNTLKKMEKGVCPIYQSKVDQILSYPAKKPKISLDHCIGKMCHDVVYFDSGLSDHLAMMFRLGRVQTA